jgi:uncharacterized membrane protein
VRSASARALLLLVVLTGIGVRAVLVFEKPLWADEIFTLTLARKPAASIVEALRADSGPPIHYFLSRLVLLPFGPSPGPHDVAVRLLSFGASLLHFPLLVLVARRLGRPEAGLTAAALYALFPLAADYAAEGRGYAVASLLALAALERALALREAPTAGRAAALALAAGGAVGTHYLALFPVAGLAALVPGAGRRSKAYLALGGAGGALLFLPWFPIALRQPGSSMAWSHDSFYALAPLHVVVNLAWGLAPPAGFLAPLVPLSLLLFAVALVAAFRGPLRPAASVFAAGLLFLGIAGLAARSLLLPERPAVLFLPLVALLFAGAPRAVPLLSGAASAAGLVLTLRATPGPSPGGTLAALLVPRLRDGRSVCAPGLWGPELDYRLARAGLPGRVVLFPSDVERHRGWYREGGISDERLRSEAQALVAAPRRPRLFVLPRDLRASAALEAASRSLPVVPVASNAFVRVVEVP